MAGITVKASTSELHQLAVDLKAIDRALQTNLRRRIRAAAAPMVAAIRAAAAWSTRIPAATRLTVSFGARSAAVAVIVDAARAPEAVVLEHGGQPGDFRHPVFGHRDRWVSQPARPFFWRTIRSFEGRIDAAVLGAMEDAARAAGFH